MSNPMEGHKMDPKLARILAEHASRVEEEATAVNATNDSNASEPVDKLAEMFGTTKAKALRRGAKTREEILRRKLPDY